MNKGLLAVICLSLAVMLGLFGYGFHQGQQMGELGASDMAVGLVGLSLNPLSQTGFKAGYQKGAAKKLERDKRIKEYLGPWLGWASKDKITDFENYTLVNEADIAPPGKKVGLVLRCFNDKTQIYIKWSGYLIGDRNGQLAVTHRIDSNKAITSNWTISTDNEHFFYSGNSISLIRSLIGSENLIIQFNDRGTKTLTFRLENLTEKVQPLSKACNWQN